MTGKAVHFPETVRAWARLKAAIADCWELWRVARYLERRTEKRAGQRLIRRIADGTYWAPGSPQNFAYAMRGLFVRGRCDEFHFYRLREWRGLWVASRKVFWKAASGEFTLLADATVFALPPWPEAVECAKIDAIARIEARSDETPQAAQPERREPESAPKSFQGDHTHDHP
jgi:hypothetical protein